MREFGFEVRLCAHLEAESDGIVARQLGAGVHAPGRRVLDVVCVEPGPEFDRRVALTGEEIPDAAIESDVAPGRMRYWRPAFECHPERARRAVDRAIEIGFFESERRNGREYVRQVARYPDWFSTIRAIENKPDLGTPGDLETQLRKDVSLALVDEVILATESYVTGAHLNRIPEEVGIWRVRAGSGGASSGSPGGGSCGSPTVEVEVVREPTRLPVDEPGVELVDEHPGRSDVRVATPAEKARARRRIAERAYGKGWRTYDFPSCGRVESVSAAEATSLPHCAWKGRIVDPGNECGPSCPGFVADEPPDVDQTVERERATAWNADPAGLARRQSGLDRFK